MELKIYKLTPERLGDYLWFFENVAHSDNPIWAICYCLDYCSEPNAGVDLSDNAVKRQMAIDYVNRGAIQGYLAYYEGRVVGWCNANRKADCMECMGWAEEIGPEARNSVQDVKSVFCFTVDPAMRGKGIAEALLRRVIADAAGEGYSVIEGYPNKGESDMYYSYVGPLALYEKLGFSITGETRRGYIVRKNLQNDAVTIVQNEEARNV